MDTQVSETETGASSRRDVTLVSQEGVPFKVDIEIARMFGLVNAMMMGEDGDDGTSIRSIFVSLTYFVSSYFFLVPRRRTRNYVAARKSADTVQGGWLRVPLCLSYFIRSFLNVFAGFGVLHGTQSLSPSGN